MTRPDPQEQYKHLKKATVLTGLGAICIFIFDALMIGAPIFSVFVVIYAIQVMATFGFYSYDLSIARQRSEVIITAIEQYHQDTGQYPDTLHNLVPAYLSEILKPRIAPGVFYYFGAPDGPHLMYVNFPPFGRTSWSFRNREWIEID